MTFQMTNDFVKNPEQDRDFPLIPNGQYQVQFSDSKIETFASKDNSFTNFNSKVTMFMPDGGTRIFFCRLLLETTAEKLEWRVNKDQNRLFDLYQAVIKYKFHGDVSQFSNLNADTIHLVDDTIIEVVMGTEDEAIKKPDGTYETDESGKKLKKKVNAIVNFLPEPKLSQPTPPPVQQPMQTPVQQQQVQQAPTAQGGMPPFMQQQQQQQ